MINKGFTIKFKPLEILSEEQLGNIHRASLEVLQNTGFRVENEKALKLFKENGCRIDFENKKVYFPPYLVEKCLELAPSSFHVKARDPKDNLCIGGNTMYFSSSAGMQILDLETQKPRIPTRNECYDYMKILDALETVHFIGPYPIYGFEGVPPIMYIPEVTASIFRSSTKTYHAGPYLNGVDRFSIMMSQAIGMEVIGTLALSPPLTLYNDAVEAAYRFIEAGFPLHVTSGPVMGGTAPITIAGATITNNAEIMAGVVFTQLVKPGTPIIVDNFTYPVDMRTGNPSFGSISSALHSAMFNQIWKNYKIPTWIDNGGISNSKRIDIQCGYEKAIATFSAALSCANIQSVHGAIYGELTAHPVQAIIDDDLIGMIGRFIEGVELNEDSLAIDLIEEVGSIPGHYLGKEHTRLLWRKEHFIPKTADNTTYQEWERKGRKSALELAKERMQEILKTHETTPLPDDVEREIEKILQEARDYYKKIGLL
jgi:trimethylamine---corrinoid protein Co-methyltransferase